MSNSNETSLVFRIWSLIKSFLGPNKSLKCIIDGTDSYFTCCPLSVLQLISLSNPLEHLIEKTLYSHHEHYGCGTSSLLAMWYFWHDEFKNLLEEGHCINDIISVSEDCLNRLILLLPKIEISVKKLLCSLEGPVVKSKVSKTCFHKCKSGQIFSRPKSSLELVNSNCSEINAILSHSRHFSSHACDEDVCFSDYFLSSNYMEKNEISVTANENLISFAKKLSHGSSKLINVITEVWKGQVVNQKDYRFSPEFITVCQFIGNSENFSLNGVLLKCYEAPKVFNIKNSCLLISGDLTACYVHLGFSPAVNISVEKSFDQLCISKKDTWLKKCFHVLLEFQITLLLIKGAVESEIKDFCCTHHITLVNCIPQSTFDILVKASNALPAAYLTECCKENIVNNITVHSCPSNEFFLKHPCATNYVIINVKKEVANSAVLQTVVLCHPSSSVLSLYEHQFLHFMHRLAHATREATLLPGGGFTEKWCRDTLYSMTSNFEGGLHVKNAIASGFHGFFELIAEKEALNGDNHEALDVKEIKIQTWHSALALVFVTLQVDSVVINGCDQSIYSKLSESQMFIGCL